MNEKKKQLLLFNGSSVQSVITPTLQLSKYCCPRSPSRFCRSPPPADRTAQAACTCHAGPRRRRGSRSGPGNQPPPSVRRGPGTAAVGGLGMLGGLGFTGTVPLEITWRRGDLECPKKSPFGLNSLIPVLLFFWWLFLSTVVEFTDQ